MENRAQEFADKFDKHLEPIKKLISDIKIGDWFAVGEDVSGLASGILTFITNAVASVPSEDIGQAIADMICGINWAKLTWDFAGLADEIGKQIVLGISGFSYGGSKQIAKWLGADDESIKKAKKEYDKLINHIIDKLSPHALIKRAFEKPIDFDALNNVAEKFTEFGERIALSVLSGLETVFGKTKLWKWIFGDTSFKDELDRLNNPSSGKDVSTIYGSSGGGSRKFEINADIKTDKEQAQTDVNKTITEVNKSGNTKSIGTSVTADTKNDANRIHASVSSAFSLLPKLKTGVLSTTPVEEIWRPYSNYFYANNLKTGVKTTTPFSSLYTQYSEPFAKNPLKTGVSLTKSGTQLRNETQSGFGAKNLSVGITTTSANSVFSQFESSWNKISSNKILSVGANLVVNSVKTVAGMTMALKADGGIFANGTWRPVTAYASGGTPTSGEMFLAREKGPELVGTIGGHTAVMNNNQIVSSVAAGVADAVANVMMAFSGQQRTEEPYIEVTIKSDSETLYHTVQKGKQKADRRYHVVAEF